MILGSAEISSQLVLQPEPLFLGPGHSGEWRRDPAVVMSPEIPTRASTCCWAAQKGHRSAETSWLHRHPVGVFGSLRTFPPGFSWFSQLPFLCFFSLFRGSWRKCNETVEFPECSPSSHRFCAVRGHVALWSWTDNGLSGGFVSRGPTRARGSQSFDQSHGTVGDVASQSQGLQFLVRGYL